MSTETVTLKQLQDAVSALPDRLPRVTDSETGAAEPVNLREFIKAYFLTHGIEVDDAS